MFCDKFRSRLIVAALLLGVFVSFSAEAALDLKWYRHSKSLPEAQEHVESYISGLRDGIILLDAYRHRFENINEKFCTSGKGLSAANTIALVDLEIAALPNGKPYPEDIPIVFILIKALERFAPCK